MRKKTLLILAASYYQVEVILRAKELGYRVVTADNAPENPGHGLADRAHFVDTTDREGILRVAELERIDGILSPASDVAVPTVAHVAARLGLPGPPQRAADTLCDKRSFVAFLARQGFPAPEAIPVRRDSDIGPEFFAAGPGILKPDRSSGAKGVFVVASPADYAARLPETLSFSPTGRGLLMRFVDGYQGTLIGLMRGGRLSPAFFLDRETRLPPYATTLGLYLPGRSTERMQRRIVAQVSEMWRLLDLGDEALVCDFVAAGEEVFILEITPRLGGSSVNYLIRQATGFDLITYCIRSACGDRPELHSPSGPRPSALILLGPARSGPLGYDEGEVERLRCEPWVRRLKMDFPTGTRVDAFANGRTRVGECLVQAASRDELSERASELRRRLDLEIDAAPTAPSPAAS